MTTGIPTDDADNNRSLLLSATKLWIVIGCIIALVIVAIVQAGCTIYRTMKHPVPHHKVFILIISSFSSSTNGCSEKQVCL